MASSRDERTPLSRAELGMIAAAVVLAGVGAALWFTQRAPREGTISPAPVATVETGGDAAPAAPSQATVSGEPEPVGADRARELLAPISTDPAYARWLDAGDLVRRWVVLTDNVAEGVSPRRQLAFLAPRGPFAVERKGDERVIAPGSYERYDAVADTVASIDAQALARVYRTLHPVLEAAYRALGYPGASLDRVTAKALRRIADAPVAEGDVAVKAEKSVFVFADPALEKQGAVEKHLLRMGPRNTRLLKAKALEIEQALGSTIAVSPPGSQR